MTYSSCCYSRWLCCVSDTARLAVSSF